AEEGTGKRDNSAGVTLITTDGRVGRLISGLPSTQDAGDLAGVPLIAFSPDRTRLYLGNFGQGHLWALDLTPEQQASGFPLPDTPLSPADLRPVMGRLNNVLLVNPFDLTFDSDGRPVVTDASANGVAVETANGKTRFFHRFAPLPNPAQPADTIEAVPTGIERLHDDEFLVTLTGGCPYPAGGGQLVAVDTRRNQRTLIDGLNMPIDIARGPDGTLWLLEFARFTPGASCFTGAGYQPESGRLSRLLPDWTVEPVLTDLSFPGAVLPAPDGSLYISEVLTGRILRITFGGPPAAQNEPAPTLRPTPALVTAQAFADVDAALAAIAVQSALTPFPGRDAQEGDTPLARLGQQLFFDPILSGDRNISCATCHHPAFALADGRVLPIGTGGAGLGPQRDFVAEVELGSEAVSVRRLSGQTDNATGVTRVANPFIGQFIPRNSPTVLNSALLPRQFWDGRVDGYARASVQTLENEVNRLGLGDPLAAQALFPVTSLHEMAGATLGGLPPADIRRILAARLEAIPAYREQFAALFGPADDDKTVTPSRMAAAIAAFERRLIFTDAPWDRYLAGDANALTDQQKQGALIFYGAAKAGVNCAQCHTGDLFTDLNFHNLLIPQLGPGKGHSYSRREDWGRAAFTFDSRDRYAFRTPSLRNVDLTPPYFHNGAAPSLEAAIRHHADPWNSAANFDPSANAIPPALYSSLQPFQPERQWSTAAPALVDGLPLDDADIADLVAFLAALTDPAATDLAWLIPESLPSALPLDPLPLEKAGITRPASQPVSALASAAPHNLAGASGAIRFRDVAEEIGLNFRHAAFRWAVTQDPVAAMGGGLCWLDYDNDGWLDLYLVNSHALAEKERWLAQGDLPRNALYRNAQGRFVDVSDGSGADLALRGNGCLAADFNNDGWTDLYVTAAGPNALLWNNGDGTFSAGAAQAGVDAPEWNSAAVAGDLNGDGLIDLFVAAYLDLKHKIPKPVGAFPQDYYGLPDRLYLNAGIGADGRASFREVTAEAGLLRAERGLGALLSDLDQDGDLDLYIANDGHPNRLYANEPVADDPAGLGFRLVDVTEAAGVGDTGSGMGVAGGDYDGDGWGDLLITNWERELNALYRNGSAEAAPLVFQYSTFRVGVAGLGSGLTGWGVHLADFDQDTDTDLLILNGRVPVTNLATDREEARYYRNRTVNLDGATAQPATFFDWSGQVGLKEQRFLGRGSALADFDNDGDLDVALVQIGGPLVLLRNDGEPGHWLQVTLDPPSPGAVAVAELPDGRLLRRELHAGSSYLATEDPRLHFGLGGYASIPHLSVVWPDGVEESYANVASDQMIRVER
ncbi:MAG: ScyD/ScyE family protein, partial [Chloroflexi bacterium]|nr:ScyD/ScyE family protein [Chloroflexota bacterium]